jgi:hypothetical protein
MVGAHCRGSANWLTEGEADGMVIEQTRLVLKKISSRCHGAKNDGALVFVLGSMLPGDVGGGM